MKNLWKLLDGWKTAIAAAYWPVYTQIIPIWWPEGLPPDANKVFLTIGIALSILGVGHKWYKKTHVEESVK
jgi:hypothetical protein